MHWLIQWLSIVPESLLDCFAKTSDGFDVVELFMAFIILFSTQKSPIEIIGSLDWDVRLDVLVNGAGLA